MKQNRKHITVFEHQTIRLNQEIDGTIFDESTLNALERLYGEKGVPYFSLTHNGVRFQEYVGVLQVGLTTIEVLPKADNLFDKNEEKKHWRDILIKMLFAVGIFDVDAPSSSSLRLESNSILDLYFELFIKEIEYLLHSGLVKQYRKKDDNLTALKGCLKFDKQIQKNHTHQERLFVRHTTYDVEHKFHFILYKVIGLLKKINTNVALHSRIGALLLHFPVMPDICVTKETFDKLVFTRKNQSYKKAIDIAKLLLLHYHPDVKNGRNNVLALMFDMNNLWEKFVYASIRKHREESTVSAQTSMLFWRPENGYISQIRPDIVINKNATDCMVLDTKWKSLNGFNPSLDDLRQMYVYHKYYGAKKVALVYPGSIYRELGGTYIVPKTNLNSDMECGVFHLCVKDNIHEWQKDIYKAIKKWMVLKK